MTKTIVKIFGYGFLFDNTLKIEKATPHKRAALSEPINIVQVNHLIIRCH